MKAKLKDNRLLLTVVFFCILVAVLLWPAGVKAATAGDFTVTGDTSEYSFKDGVLTVNSGADLTIKNTNPGTATSNRIVVAGNASITLSGVNINTQEKALSIQDSADVNLTLVSENTLHSTKDHQGVGLNLGSSADVIIDGNGSLRCGSGNNCGAAIMGGTIENGAVTVNGSTITVNGGTVMASAGPFSIGILVKTLNIKGGMVNAEGDSKPGIKGDTVNVSGGTLIAEGGSGGAGINSNVNISGGTVKATGGGDGGAGIGGNSGEDGKTVTISGGNVTAQGRGTGAGGAGIGGGPGYGAAGSGGAGGKVTISGGMVIAKGGGYAAGIGGGRAGHGGDVVITGGSVAAAGIGGGGGVGGTTPGTLTDGSGSGSKVYLNTLTVGESAVSDGIAITSTDSTNPNTLTNGYGVKDVVTMDGGKLYFYLPSTTEASNQPIELKAGTDSTVYSRNYIRSWDYTATLLPPPTYTITIPEKVDFGTLAYQPAGNSGQYNDKTFEVTPANLTNLTDGRSLSVMVSGSGTNDAFVMKTDDGAELPYSVYKDSAASGNPMQPRKALFSDWTNNSSTAQQGTLRLDQTQIKYSGSYTGTLTFTVNVVDSK